MGKIESIAVLAVVGVGAYALWKFKDFKLPEFKFPELSLPDVNVNIPANVQAVAEEAGVVINDTRDNITWYEKINQAWSKTSSGDIAIIDKALSGGEVKTTTLIDSISDTIFSISTPLGAISTGLTVGSYVNDQSVSCSDPRANFQDQNGKCYIK